MKASLYEAPLPTAPAVDIGLFPQTFPLPHGMAIHIAAAEAIFSGELLKAVP